MPPKSARTTVLKSWQTLRGGEGGGEGGGGGGDGGAIPGGWAGVRDAPPPGGGGGGSGNTVGMGEGLAVPEHLLPEAPHANT